MSGKKIICLLEDIGQGGAERQLIGLASMLANDGNEVKMLIYHNDLFYLPLLNEAGVECVYFDKAKNKLFRIPIIIKYICKYKPNTIIAFLNTPSIIACLAKLLLHSFKLIVSERNTNQNISFVDKIKFFLYKYADYIVPNSYSQTKFIESNFHKLRDKIVTITNFTDTNYFCPIQNKANNNLLKIVCVGRVSEQKNVKLFIDAIKKVVDNGLLLEVNWYGRAFHPYYEECLELLKRNDLEKVFVFHKETIEVKKIYQESDLLVLPSLYEGFPNVVCEAMSCGLPILCSDICDNGRIVRNGINGMLFNPMSVDEIANSIIEFSQKTKEEREYMCEKSREFALSDFSIEVFFEKYKKLIYET